MSQIKIYALKNTIETYRDDLSRAIHYALVEKLSYPEEKKFQRFIALEQENFIFPKDRSNSYVIIEVSMFVGRTKETKKEFIQALFKNIHVICGIEPQDIEITIYETPLENWGIRGKNGDELNLGYVVDV